MFYVCCISTFPSLPFWLADTSELTALGAPLAPSDTLGVTNVLFTSNFLSKQVTYSSLDLAYSASLFSSVSSAHMKMPDIKNKYDLVRRRVVYYTMYNVHYQICPIEHPCEHNFFFYINYHCLSLNHNTVNSVIFCSEPKMIHKINYNIFPVSFSELEDSYKKNILQFR